MILPIVAELWARHEGDIERRLEEFVVRNKNRRYPWCEVGEAYSGVLQLALSAMLDPESSKPYFDPASVTAMVTSCYTGTVAFILKRSADWFVPYAIYTTWSEYGSCESCDAIKNAMDADTDEEKVLRLKRLVLHMLQHIKPIITEDEYHEEL